MAVNPPLTDRPPRPHRSRHADRPALDPRLLRDLPPPWRAVDILAEAPSTNRLLADRARAGAEPGVVMVTEHQTAGRGRLGRTWETPPRAALTFSALVRPVEVAEARWPWLTVLAGVAVAEGLAASGAPECRLKWPNDVLCQDRKLGGLLAERVDTPAGPALVLGVGLNVSTADDELPVDGATSLVLSGMAAPDRTSLLRGLLEALGARYTRWVDDRGDPEPLAADYRRWCATLGQQVRVDLPAGEVLEGVARDVDRDGALVLSTARGRVTVSAGDVVHLRPGRPSAGRP